MPAPPASPTIVVVGHGVVETPPDVATIAIVLRGEGVTSDAAAAKLAANQGSVVDGLRAFVGDMRVENGRVALVGVRASECKTEDEDMPRLSTGVCAVRGFVATLTDTVRFAATDQAGTAVAIAVRLGASEARIEGFGLRTPSQAHARAIAAAAADAHAQASAIARSAGVRLGPIVRVVDEAAGATGQDIVVTAQRRASPAMALPPVVIAVRPTPIESDASLGVTFAILP